MTARTLILPTYDGGADFRRWSFSAAIVLAAHSGLIAGYLLLAQESADGSLQAPAVIVEMAPLPAAPNSPIDLAPGPEMVESPAQTQQLTETKPEKAVPMPQFEAPAEVTLPPQVEKPIEQQKPEEVPEVKKPEPVKAQEMTPAPATTAPLRSELPPAPVARAPSPGSVESRQIANWRDLIVARLQQAKRYPSGSESRREQGIATLSFTVDRSGRVLARSIKKSSGHAALDDEVLALVQRAQPLPPFPPAMTQAVVNLTVPIRFSLR